MKIILHQIASIIVFPARKRKKNKIVRLSKLVLSLLLLPMMVTLANSNFTDPTASEKELLDDFKIFDIKYAQRNKPSKLNGDAWISLARTFAAHQATLILSKNYELRTKLIKGECYLFASQEYFKMGRSEFLENYKTGIQILEEIVLEVHNSDTPGTDDYIPSFSKMVSGINLHEYAGFESIGTGFEKGFSGRNVSYSYDTHASLEQYIAYLRPYIGRVINRGGDPKYSSELDQISTSNAARELLSEFCPWGVKIFALMEKQGLTSQLDFRILRPYVERDLDKAFHNRVFEKFTSNLEWFVLNEGEPYDLFETPPLLSEMLTSPESVPKAVRNEMNQIVGIEPDHNQFKFHEGTIGEFSKKQIKWLTVGDPSYSLQFVSPMIYTEWTFTDYTSLLFYLMTWYNGGMIWGAASVGADIAVSYVLDDFMNYLNTSLPTPCVTDFIMQSGHDQYVNHTIPLHRRLTTWNRAGETISQREWVDPKGMAIDIFKWVFSQFESHTREVYFNGVDPKKIKVGKTYNGDQIPPVILVSNVSGIMEVPDEEYPNTIHIHKYYLLYPKGNFYTLFEYDLEKVSSFNEYQNYNNIELEGYSYPLKMKSSKVETSLAPNCQSLEFELDTETTKLITEDDKVEIVLMAKDLDSRSLTYGEDIKYATAIIKPHDESFNFKLYNEQTQTRSYENHFSSYDGAEGNMVRITDEELLSKSEKGEYHIALVPIKAQYDLVIKINGEGNNTININLYDGPRGGDRDPVSGQRLRSKIPITGELVEVPNFTNYVQLNYDKKIKLPFGEVAKHQVNE